MRVAIFTDTYPPFINGVSTSCYNLAKTLKEHLFCFETKKVGRSF